MELGHDLTFENRMEPQFETPAEGAPIRRDRLSKERKRTRKGKTRLLTLDALDGRTAAYVAARKLVETMSRDLGGADQLSEGERQLVQRVALVGAIVSDFETKWVAGQKIELGDYLQACRTQCRLLSSLGLQRRSRDITNSLHFDGDAVPSWSPIRSSLDAARRIAELPVDAEILP
jgi:hypothetical protein